MTNDKPKSEAERLAEESAAYWKRRADEQLKRVDDKQRLIDARDAELAQQKYNTDVWHRSWQSACEKLDPLRARNAELEAVLEAVRSQMCWERDRDQLTMGMTDLHDSVTKALKPKDSQR